MNSKSFNIFGIVLACLLMSSTFASASAYSIKTMTPEVKSALESRRDRYDQIIALKDANVIGENNRGYVQLLQDNGNASSLVAAENADRKVIYQTIADQNGLTEALSTIEEVFAQVQRDKAKAGHQIQTSDGSWKTK